jgi:glutamyl-tRNA synthetase
LSIVFTMCLLGEPMAIRTRFAPSPTGVLHIGSIRTALYAWLFAKHNDGQFILRIEDTDSVRSTKASIDAIIEGMNWLGLNYDEGPYYQTQNYKRYQSIIDDWLDKGLAYRCYCSKERLELLRQEQFARKEKPKYDGACRDKNLSHSDKDFVVRFKNPLEGEVKFDDLVYGTMSVHNKELDDLIIQRSDGHPTYNLTVIVDDSDMNISHVIRGDDHINNTFRQINLLKAFNDAPLPTYAHLPTILGEDGKRLSKRHGAVGIEEFKEQGFVREALINYLVRLGWSHGDKEIFSIDEMIELFDIKNVGRGCASFNYEKLSWLNQHYLKTLPKERLLADFEYFLAKEGFEADSQLDLVDILTLQAERYKTLAEIAKNSEYFFKAPQTFDEKAKNKFLLPEHRYILELVKEKFKTLDAWETANLMPTLKDVAKERELKLGKVAPCVRVAVTGGTNSPSLDAVLALIGKEQTLSRIQFAIDYLTPPHDGEFYTKEVE